VSTALAIAAVTAGLRERLREVYNLPEVSMHFGSSVAVSATAPGGITVTAATRQVNLFLYEVTPNQGWWNRELSARDSRGERNGTPPLSLDLNYMLTAYAQQDFEAESLLGYAMQAFHEQPGLGRRGIRDAAVASTDSRVRQVLSGSELAEQEEWIKLSLQPMGAEEMSKMWTAFQAQYYPSVAYRASVAIIRSELEALAPLPVREARVHVPTLRRPHVDAVRPQILTAGSTLTLVGSGLAADSVQVLFGDLPSPRLPLVTDPRIDAVLPAGLRSGVNTARVDQPIDVKPGPEVDLRRGTDSNAVAFMLAPRIASHPVSVARGSRLTLTVEPAVGRGQRVDLLLGTTSLRWHPPDGTWETTATLGFEIPAGFPAGDHLLRIRVDRAESALDADSEGRYVGPLLTVAAT